jgi:hypothetical protein
MTERFRREFLEHLDETLARMLVERIGEQTVGHYLIEAFLAKALTM